MRQVDACVNRTPAMAKEIEIKLRNVDAAALREVLSRGGWRRDGAVFEINHILDTPDQTVAKTGGALRLRVARPLDADAAGGATLTLKGPREPGPEKVREEIETGVGDAAALLRILERLGLREKIRYEKRRETWRRDDAEVVIDELPRLGGFVEIEAASRESVRALRSELGLDDADIEPRGYVELTARHGEPLEDGAVALTFDTRS
ncbi:MAG: CYTH domain-containing protein [Planctomycetota bacterium]|nr:MAG: CYTH domain-containing protein [Planctomycetota bacterium]